MNSINNVIIIKDEFNLVYEKSLETLLKINTNVKYEFKK
tara:strand:+ start:1207 stop:1323 length:117 start_codon:yes stop_codon:yes gene_type:complete